MATKRLNFRKTYSKIISLEAVRGIMLKRSRIIYSMQLLKFFGCYDNLNFPKSYNGKMKIGINCCLIVTILIKLFLQKCSMSTSLLNCIIFVQTAEFDLLPWQQKYSNINSSEAMGGINLKLCRNVHKISLYKTKIVFLLPLFEYFCFYGT